MREAKISRLGVRVSDLIWSCGLGIPRPRLLPWLGHSSVSWYQERKKRSLIRYFFPFQGSRAQRIFRCFLIYFLFYFSSVEKTFISFVKHEHTKITTFSQCKRVIFRFYDGFCSSLVSLDMIRSDSGLSHKIKNKRKETYLFFLSSWRHERVYCAR